MAASEPLLIVAGANGDGEAIRQALAVEFDNVHVSEQPERAAEDFDRVQPDVIVFALPTILDAEKCYLGLFRSAATIGARPHRTILLCTKDEVQQAYDECVRGRFDDYVLYWPVAYDPPRLAMSVHLARRTLQVARAGAGDKRAAEVARQLEGLVPQVDQALTATSGDLRRADESLRRLASEVVEAVNDASRIISDRIVRMPGGASVATQVKRQLEVLSDEHVRPHIAAASTLLAPARDGLDKLSRVCRTGLDAARRIASEPRNATPSILIVEDEPTQRQVYKHLLPANRYALTFAPTGAEAIRHAIRNVPDLIVMDIELPDVNGIEVIGQLKRHASLAKVPVIVVTGHRERSIVVQSRAAGAADFLIKPFTPKAFMQKLERHLKAVRPQAA